MVHSYLSNHNQSVYFSDVTLNLPLFVIVFLSVQYLDHLVFVFISYLLGCYSNVLVSLFFLLYADSTHLYYLIPFSFNDIVGIIIIAYQAFTQSLLCSLPKISCWFFYCSRSLQSIFFTLNFDGSIITYFEYLRNLGVIFDTFLSFKDHMEFVNVTYFSFFFATLGIFALTSPKPTLKQLFMLILLLTLLIVIPFQLTCQSLLSSLFSVYQIMMLGFYIVVVNLLI